MKVFFEPASPWTLIGSNIGIVCINRFQYDPPTPATAVCGCESRMVRLVACLPIDA